MPRVKTIETRYVDDEGEGRVLRSPVEVSAEGVFSAVVPDWLEANLRALPSPSDAPQRLPWRGVSLERPRVNLRVEAGSLAPLEAALRRALEDYSAPVVVRSTVILYHVETSAAAWRMPDGRVFPNGAVAMRVAHEEGIPSDRAGAWIPGLQVAGGWNGTRPSYEVKVGAMVMTRVESRRGASVVVTYERLDEKDLEDPAPALEINGYVHLWLGEGDKRRVDGDVREMPYTPESGAFFARMMAAITHLAIGLNAFFAEAETLPARIAAGGSPLALPAPVAKDEGDGGQG